jgi:hypothetical protein
MHMLNFHDTAIRLDTIVSILVENEQLLVNTEYEDYKFFYATTEEAQEAYDSILHIFKVQE